MAIWISILLAILPKLLEWLFKLFKDRKKIPANQLEKLNHITYYTSQISAIAPKVGCAVGGVNPDGGD